MDKQQCGGTKAAYNIAFAKLGLDQRKIEHLAKPGIFGMWSDGS